MKNAHVLMGDCYVNIFNNIVLSGLETIKKSTDRLEMLSLIIQQTLTDQMISDIDINEVLRGYFSISSNHFALLFTS